MTNYKFVPTITAENDRKINFRVEIFERYDDGVYTQIGVASMVLAKHSNAILYFSGISRLVDHVAYDSFELSTCEITDINHNIYVSCNDLKEAWV